MAFKVEGEARVAFTNTPGQTPAAPDNGEIKVQQADGKLITRRADGSARETLLDAEVIVAPGNPVGDAIANAAKAATVVGLSDATASFKALNVSDVAAPGNPIGNAIAAKLGLTRIGLAQAIIPAVIISMALAGYYAEGDRAFGMPMVRTNAADTDPTKVSDGSAPTGYWKLNAPDVANVFWLGAKGDVSTNDTAAFTLATQVTQTVYAPAALYNVQNFTLPAGKRFRGDGERETILRPTTACNWVFRALQGTDCRGFCTNGNTFAQRGFSIGGDHVNLQDWRGEYCISGLHNEPTGVVLRTLNTSTANCTYSIYSAGGWNNSKTTAHISDGDTWGAFFTYADGLNPDLDQPQAVRFSECLFFGNKNGIWFDKNVFVFSFVNSVIDGCPGTAIRIGPNSSTIKIFGGNFISGQVVAIDICEGTNDVDIFGNGGIANGFTNILCRATATKRCSNVHIYSNAIGVATSSAITLDSVLNASVIDNGFSPAGAALYITTQATYTGPGGNPPVIVERNHFPQTSGPVNTTNTRSRDNVGWKTNAAGVVQVGSSGTVVVQHGMSIPPGRIMISAGGNIGILWYGSVTNSSFTIIVSGPPPSGTVPISWEAYADAV